MIIDPASGSFAELDNLDAHVEWQWHHRFEFVENDRRGTPGDPVPPDDRLNDPYGFRVSPDDVGMPLTFAVKKREALYEMDRIVFTLEAPANNTVAALDALVNSPIAVPEPSTLILVGIMAIGCSWRSRRGTAPR